MSTAVERLDRKWYPDCTGNWDDEIFRATIAQRVDRTSRVLDLGAGAGIVSQMNFRGMAGHVSGVDLDSRVLTNPYLDNAKVGSAERLPFADGEFDLVFADNVLEHLPDPLAAFQEISRVLRPGGHFLAKTPNKWHYMPLMARLTPHSFHRFYNRLRGRAGEDTFPTRYRANSPGAIHKLARSAGMQVRSIDLIERRPEYLRIHPATYFIGRAYERLVNGVDALAVFRILLIIELQKDFAATRVAA